MLGDTKSRTHIECCKLKTDRRWCLGSACMQDWTSGIYNQLRFLNTVPMTASLWKQYFVEPAKKGDTAALARLMQDVSLKRECEEAPVLSVHYHTQLVPMNLQERRAYDAVRNHCMEILMKATGVCPKRSSLKVCKIMRAACSGMVSAHDFHHISMSTLNADALVSEHAGSQEYLRNLRAQIEEGIQCAICLETARQPAVTTCVLPHIFCMECLFRVRPSTQGYMCCPTCREPIQKDGIRLLCTDKLEVGDCADGRTSKLVRNNDGHPRTFNFLPPPFRVMCRTSCRS